MQGAFSSLSSVSLPFAVPSLPRPVSPLRPMCFLHFAPLFSRPIGGAHSLALSLSHGLRIRAAPLHTQTETETETETGAPSSPLPLPPLSRPAAEAEAEAEALFPKNREGANKALADAGCCSHWDCSALAAERERRFLRRARPHAHAFPCGSLKALFVYCPRSPVLVSCSHCLPYFVPRAAAAARV
jgi:hypothetical protein